MWDECSDCSFCVREGGGERLVARAKMGESVQGASACAGMCSALTDL